MRNLAYLRYVLVHKWHVFKAGVALGDIPLIQLITHDWSKFSKEEWAPYRDFFHIKDDATFEARKQAFDYALQHHYTFNDHHPQHWGGGIMPITCVREMVADWIGAARSQGRQPTLMGQRDWYEQNRTRLGLHPTTEQDTYLVLAEAFTKGLLG